MALKYRENGATRIVVAEYMAHSDETVADRLQGFFRAARFLVSTHEGGLSIRVTPDVLGDDIPAISYWRTSNPTKLERFIYYNPEGLALPSSFARGYRYPWLQDTVEVPLELPKDEDVIAVYEGGGVLLAQHTYAGPREHPGGTGRLEIRVEDPINMSVRITGPNRD